MMRRKIGTIITTAIVAMAMMMPTFAGVWEGDASTGYRYKNDDGTYAVSTFTPDGYYVGADGLWTGGANNITGAYVYNGIQVFKTDKAVLIDNVYYVSANVYDTAFFSEAELASMQQGQQITISGVDTDKTKTPIPLTVTKVVRSNKITVKGDSTNANGVTSSTKNSTAKVYAVDAAGNTYKFMKNVCYRTTPAGVESIITKYNQTVDITISSYRILKKIVGHYQETTLDNIIMDGKKYYTLNIVAFSVADEIEDISINY